MATKKLACPDCSCTKALATIEQILGDGLANSMAIDPDLPQVGANVQVDWAGGTTVHWDSSTTIGVLCSECGWSYVGPDWPEKLAFAGDADPE